MVARSRKGREKGSLTIGRKFLTENSLCDPFTVWVCETEILLIVVSSGNCAMARRGPIVTLSDDCSVPSSARVENPGRGIKPILVLLDLIFDDRPGLQRTEK